MSNWLFAFGFSLLVLALFLLFVIDQREKAGGVSLDIPEQECPTPIYTAHGDYALCIK